MNYSLLAERPVLSGVEAGGPLSGRSEVKRNKQITVITEDHSFLFLLLYGRVAARPDLEPLNLFFLNPS
jgi:hypothetical protein